MENPFEHCTFPIDAPMLKTTRLADYDYAHMFDNVKLTVEAPMLSTVPEWYQILCVNYNRTFGRAWSEDIDITRRIIGIPDNVTAAYITENLPSILQTMATYAEL